MTPGTDVPESRPVTIAAGVVVFHKTGLAVTGEIFANGLTGLEFVAALRNLADDLEDAARKRLR